MQLSKCVRIVGIVGLAWALASCGDALKDLFSPKEPEPRRDTSLQRLPSPPADTVAMTSPSANASGVAMNEGGAPTAQSPMLADGQNESGQEGAAAGGAQALPSVDANLLPQQVDAPPECEGVASGQVCREGREFICEHGSVIAEQACPVAKCQSDEHCVSLAGVGVTTVMSPLEASGVPDCGDLTDHPCDRCVATACCSEYEACARDTECSELLKCLADCQALDCIVGCYESRANGEALLSELQSCGNAQCLDACQAVDRCSGTGPGWGYYCARGLGGSTDDPTLHLCSNSTTVGTVTCEHECVIAQDNSGFCDAPDNPCANSPYDGYACGSNLGPAGASDVLYNCVAQQTVGTQSCVTCLANPPGTEDYCL